MSREKGIVTKQNRWFLFLWIGAVLVNIKAVFTDFGPDQTYALATSYRHLLGDGMFREMWEPHQTSTFLSDLGLWIHKLVMGTYEGAAVFLQAYGVVLYALVTVVLFRILSKYITREMTHVICLFFFVSRAKLMVYPEFSNMHIAFGVLLFLALLEFLNHQEKWHFLVLAALALCLQILSYPSCLVTYAGVVLCLFLYAKNRWKSIGIFTGVCVVAGGLYAGYFVVRLGFWDFLDNLKAIFTADTSHTGTVFSAEVFFRGTIYGLLWIGVIFVLALIINKLIGLRLYPVMMLLLLVSDVAMLYIAEAYHVDWTTIFFLLNVGIMGLGAWNVKKLSEKERSMWSVSMILSLCSAVAVFLLTNQEFLSIFAYMILGTMISFIPASKSLEAESGREWETRAFGSAPLALVLFCLFVMVHRGISVYGYLNVDGKYVLTDVENMVRVGPTKGIVTSLEECNQARDGIEDWKRFTLPGQRVLMVEQSWYDPVVYLYNENQVSAYSTIDTPVYDESLETYWQKYPEKRPEVIAIKSWNGLEDRAYEGWFAEYLKENYVTKGELTGTYWQFYVPKQ